MVTTGEILKAEQALEAAQAGLATSDEKLDDVMLAMDVVDTLRHERLMVEKELNNEDRREALIARLRDIYTAQGITVPDDVLMDGVLALEEQRFAFEPPKKGFGTWLAKIYINRGKWGPLLLTVLFFIFSALGINYLAFDRPAKLEAKRVESLLTNDYPERIEKAYSSAISVAATDNLRTRAEDLRSLAAGAISEQNAAKAEKYVDELENYAADLGTAYTVRIVYRDGRESGFIRHNDLGGRDTYNYYVIVEGIDSSGGVTDVVITNEETQKSRRTSSWAVRISKRDFDRVADDKRDDRIIQNADIGRKRRGYIKPDYTIDTDGGTLLDW